MEKDRIVSVTNRSAGALVYSIDGTNTRRQFAIGETKKVPYSEIEALSWQPGGLKLIAEYLVIKDEEALQTLSEDQNMQIEPEYALDEKGIRELMENGSLEEWQDFLDFAPEGAKDIAKELAVAMPLNDYNKRQALKNQLGFDVDKAIENNKDDEPVAEKAAPQRRTATTETKTTRRYNKVVKKTEEE